LIEMTDHAIYSGSGADTVLRDGNEARRGLFEGQLTHEWAMPPFKELWAQSKRANTLGRVYQGTVNADGISKFMESVWKPTTLLRLGFPIRAGGEELGRRDHAGRADGSHPGPGRGWVRPRAKMLAEADRISPDTTRSPRSGAACPAICQKTSSTKIDQPSDYIGAVLRRPGPAGVPSGRGCAGRRGLSELGP
jgi:hypothetical protein